MKTPFHNHLIIMYLLGTLICLQACEDEIVPIEKSKVQFALSAGASPHGRISAIDLPANASLRLTIESISGTPCFSDHEIQVSKVGDAYVADKLSLQPGRYVLTDVMIVNDSSVLHATPKDKSPFSSFVTHSLPYNFSVNESDVTQVNIQVLDARHEKPELFGYALFKFMRKENWLSFIVTNAPGGQKSLQKAYAELRQGKRLIKRVAARVGLNIINFTGEPDAIYTLSVLAGEAAKAKTFNFHDLKSRLHGKPFRMALEPALLLSLESSIEEGNPYEEYFDFFMDGTQGSVHVDFGDGFENSYRLPFNGMHEYTTGTYTAIVTGDLDQITNLFGFSYGTIMYAITGLTNLTALKSYNPSWGAVPIKVDLSNCKQLESISVAKYGAPYETVDLRTDFRLPEEHFIKEFIFDAPSFDITRENISAEELEVFVNNIYTNTTRRSIYGGYFYIYPVEHPSPETQRKLDILKNDYQWEVGLQNDAEARTKLDWHASRDNWLREKFPNSKRLARRQNKDFAY